MSSLIQLSTLMLASLPYTSAAPSLSWATHFTSVTSRGLQKTYDYIIVGGGTSGLTVANRLTEDPNGALFVPLFIRL
jgi:choline dehydrogenase